MAAVVSAQCSLDMASGCGPITFNEPRYPPWNHLDRTPVNHQQDIQNLISAFNEYLQFQPLPPTSPQISFPLGKSSSRVQSCTNSSKKTSDRNSRPSSGNNKNPFSAGNNSQKNSGNSAEDSGQTSSSNPPPTFDSTQLPGGPVRCPLVGKVVELPGDCMKGFADNEASIKHANEKHYRCVICYEDPRRPKARTHNNDKLTKPVALSNIYFNKPPELVKHIKTHLCHLRCPNYQDGCSERFHREVDLKKHTAECNRLMIKMDDSLRDELIDIANKIDKCKEKDPSNLAKEHELILLLPEENGKKLKKYDYKDGINRILRADTKNSADDLAKEAVQIINGLVKNFTDQRNMRRFFQTLLCDIDDANRNYIDIINDQFRAFIGDKHSTNKQFPSEKSVALLPNHHTRASNTLIPRQINQSTGKKRERSPDWGSASPEQEVDNGQPPEMPPHKRKHIDRLPPPMPVEEYCTWHQNFKATISPPIGGTQHIPEPSKLQNLNYILDHAPMSQVTCSRPDSGIGISEDRRGAISAEWLKENGCGPAQHGEFPFNEYIQSDSDDEQEINCYNIT